MAPFTPEEETLLRQERLTSELLKMRNKAFSDKPKHRLEVFANSAVLTAVVTVIGTAIAGTIISGCIQDRAKRNELELQAQRDYLRSQVDVDSKAYDLVGRYVAAADDLITITKPRFQEDFYIVWKNKITSDYDSADTEWRRTNRTTGHLLSYHHYGQSNVAEAWKALGNEVDAFASCATQFFSKHSYGAREEEMTPRPCSPENERISARLEKFRAAIETGRVLFWDDRLRERK